MLLYLGIFILAFFYEITICLYTRAVADRSVLLATIMTPVCGIFSFISVSSYIHKPSLIVPFLLGETLATYLVVKNLSANKPS